MPGPRFQTAATRLLWATDHSSPLWCSCFHGRVRKTSTAPSPRVTRAHAHGALIVLPENFALLSEDGKDKFSTQTDRQNR